MARFDPPPARQGTDVREFHGIAVPDPFRWLETTESAEVRDWVRVQNKLAGEFLRAHTRLEHCREFLDKNFCQADPTWRCVRNDRSFYLARRAGRPQPQLCMRASGGAEQVLVDPNLSGSALNPHQVAVSPSGRYVAYVLVPDGEVLGSIQVYDVESACVLESSSFTTAAPMIAWHPREPGFYYSLCRGLFVQAEPKDGVYWHSLAGDWREDRCIKPYHDGRGHLAYAIVPEGSDWLLLFNHHFSSSKSGAELCRLTGVYPESDRAAQPLTVFCELECFNQFIGCANGQLYFQTCSDAPLGKIVAVDPERPERSAWRTVVDQCELALGRPERFPGSPKSALNATGLMLTYVEHAHDTLRHFTFDGELRHRIELPELSTVDAVMANGEGFTVCTQSFLIPRAEYRCDAGVLSETSRVAMPGIDTNACELRQEFYRAKDGTAIPMYLLHRKGLHRDGDTPVLLYGYGSGNQVLAPEYTPEAALWLELGGMYALANVRGGGEYGEAWSAAGSGLNKQTSYDDFFAAAEYLIGQRYTSPSRLTAKGISSGAIMTAVCVNQRPELFAAIVSEMPLPDLLSLDDTAAGRSIAVNAGNAVTNRTEFEALYRYSPLQNVRPGITPAQIVVVADRDIAAPPAHSYKYVAARQAASLDPQRPVLLRIVHGQGHGGWPRQDSVRVLAEEIAFLHHFCRPRDASSAAS